MPFDPFDSSQPLTFEGEIVVVVRDEDMDPNSVIGYDDPFHIEWEITLQGTVPKLLFGDFQLEAFAESMGPGPEVSLGTQSVKADGSPVYKGTMDVPANTLDHAGMGTPAASGVYDLVVTAFYTNPNGTKTGISGYQKGPLVKIRQP